MKLISRNNFKVLAFISFRNYFNEKKIISVEFMVVARYIIAMVYNGLCRFMSYQEE